MKELVRHIQEEWKAAKQDAQERCMSMGNREMARKLAECDMFKGTEDLEGLVELIFSPRGIEFLTKFGFPDLATFRKFKQYRPERFGVYIDSGKITLTEARRAFLIGDTVATVKYRENTGNRLHLMHGASASVLAGGYSVVRIEKDDKSDVTFIRQDHARILM